MNFSLYMFVVLVWGTTWISIKFQLGEVPVENSIFYRFLIASFIIFSYLIVRKKSHSIKPIDHLFCFLQGCTLFCFNFYALYLATGYIESGLVCVIFSLSTIFNAINNWIANRTIPSSRTIVGSIVGVIGISLIFWQDLSNLNTLDNRSTGIFLAIIGTYSFSWGNIISIRHKQNHLPVVTTNAWGMFYGAFMMLIINIVAVGSFTFSTEPKYIISLFFLAIPGSILVFAAYLGLIGRVGPSKAAYSTILFPIIALIISYFVEGYRSHYIAIFGIALALLGNIIVFYKLRTTTLKIPKRV